MEDDHKDQTGQAAVDREFKEVKQGFSDVLKKLDEIQKEIRK